MSILAGKRDIKTNTLTIRTIQGFQLLPGNYAYGRETPSWIKVRNAFWHKFDIYLYMQCNRMYLVLRRLILFISFCLCHPGNRQRPRLFSTRMACVVRDNTRMWGVRGMLNKDVSQRDCMTRQKRSKRRKKHRDKTHTTMRRITHIHTPYDTLALFPVKV